MARKGHSYRDRYVFFNEAVREHASTDPSRPARAGRRSWSFPPVPAPVGVAAWAPALERWAPARPIGLAAPDCRAFRPVHWTESPTVRRCKPYGPSWCPPLQRRRPRRHPNRRRNRWKRPRPSPRPRRPTRIGRRMLPNSLVEEHVAVAVGMALSGHPPHRSVQMCRCSWGVATNR